MVGVNIDTTDSINTTNVAMGAARTAERICEVEKMELIKPIDCAEAIYEALRTPMLKGTFTDTMSLAMSLVKEVPTIEAEPVKHGRWVDVEPAPWGQVYKTCSECGIRQAPDKGKDMFCGVCGARMGGGENEL